MCMLHSVFWHQHTHLRTHSLHCVHMRSCMRSFFISVGGRGWEVSAELFLTEGEIEVLSVSSLSLDAGGSVCACMWVYTHTHTHTAHSVLDVVSPKFGTRHLEGPKKPDGQNLGIHICVYEYKVYMFIYMQRGGMRSWTNCFFSFFRYWISRTRPHHWSKWVVSTRLIFFLFYICFLLKMQSKKCKRKNENSNPSHMDPQSRALNYF